MLGNVATGQGTGFVVDGGAARLSNVTLVGNETWSPGSGGALVALWGAELVVTNGIFWDNDSPQGGAVYLALSSVSPELRYCAFEGNGPLPFVGLRDPVGADGNVGVAPELVDVIGDGDSSSWDVHLTPTSPLIDVGDPTITDPDGGPSDLGAWGGPGAALWDVDGDGVPECWQPGCE